MSHKFLAVSLGIVFEGPIKSLIIKIIKRVILNNTKPGATSIISINPPNAASSHAQLEEGMREEINIYKTGIKAVPSILQKQRMPATRISFLLLNFLLIKL
ncbi:MAG: hypothetical protein WCE45_02925 [Sedimentisphaerales bacterium]